ncbi:MAG: SGNH/GDSL hydrolase family protein [Treponema sp.]|jgi:lysophospholipase L1-like esterase|nr:SGNH/GDSL hydrolase family protein [Treponema sp.]
MKNIFTKNTTVLFQGDSITDCGRRREDSRSLGSGYPSIVARLYDTLFPGHGVNFLNRAVSGDRSSELLRRYDADLAALKPDLVSFLIGINDTWRRYDSNDPTSTEAFEHNYRSILQNVKNDLPSARIVIIEPFLLNTMADKLVWRGEDLDAKIAVTRRLAREFADVFIPMDGIFVSEIVAGKRDVDITADGVHPTPTGHAIIAASWLKGLGIL